MTNGQKIAMALMTLVFLMSCAHQDALKPHDTLAGMRPIAYQLHWPIFTLSPQQPINDTLRIYIEGDGRAWLKSNRPSVNPTPVNPLVHRLMAEDPSPDIAYLAQPCQFQMNDNCHSELWTFKRYSSQVVDNMNQAVSLMKAMGSYQHIELVGYSGGGTIALLLAAKREDVVSVRTVAGNLVPHYFNQLHKVTAMPEAINPVTFARQLATVPQLHFVGIDDPVVPLSLSKYYKQALVDSACVQLKTVNADHHSGWATQWADLLQQPPQCGAH